MTARERLVAAARGGEVDRAPIVCWSTSPGHKADAVVAPLAVLRKAIETHPDQAVLAEVVSPFGRALRRDVDLNTILDQDPALGAEKLEALRQETQDEIEGALSQGADGVFYVLDGAYSAASTPMQYGGRYLEVDRELLAGVTDARCNVAYVGGEEDVFLDFVADLPAHVLGWDYEHAVFGLDEARRIRAGAIAAPVAGADVVLLRTAEAVERWIAARAPDGQPTNR